MGSLRLAEVATFYSLQASLAVTLRQTTSSSLLAMQQPAYTNAPQQPTSQTPFASLAKQRLDRQITCIQPQHSPQPQGF